MKLSAVQPFVYARFVERTSWYAHHGECNNAELSYLALGLAGESGEAVDVVKKIVREGGQMQNLLDVDPKKLEALKAEMGDVLWYITNLCNLLELDLEQLMLQNTQKLYRRLIDNQKFTRDEIQWPFHPDDDPFGEETVNVQL